MILPKIEPRTIDEHSNHYANRPVYIYIYIYTTGKKFRYTLYFLQKSP